MAIKKQHLNQVKSFALTLIWAVSILVIVTNVLNYSNQENIVGKATYEPLQVFGTISPGLPDGTEISFKIRNLEIASTTLTNNAYGYEEDLFFMMDDFSTSAKEGYAPGDKVTFYIEDIMIAEISYFSGINVKKDLIIPASKREEVSTKAALAVLERSCDPIWQCSAWSTCNNGIKTRECTDLNDCGIMQEMPNESASCSLPALIEQPMPSAEKETVVGTIIAIVIASLIVLFIIYTVKRSRGKR